MREKMTMSFITGHLWIQLIMLGAIFLNTFMVYPNIFHNIPQSFNIGMDFMAVAGPNTFFPPLGFLSILTGFIAALLTWSYPTARWWVLASMGMIILEGAASIMFEWPRNEIMFIEGASVHSVEFLKQTANEFLTVHVFRVLCNIAGSIFIFVGFLRYFQTRLIK
ncbi:hypothetical protein [Jeotgalibacillus proteolyticus]|uniref:DUF1772 domain-containing protein n=1 Tax=Jeotgalibacillus proteolyticus TaxID=2082395 RepID=A0A2S5G8L0_9BACL|nr:hypothetical protein [Jeotgalibacillus proteolyticus]PPA69336.1 hypothetical protein C4B60_16190 [Jeotgalibacillus proteolyticus]